MVERVDSGEGTIVRGFIRRSPTEFLELVAHGGHTVTFQENEGYEAEALIHHGRYRNFWRLSAVCPGGSDFAVVVVGVKQSESAAAGAPPG